MSALKRLIQQHCPNGVVFDKLVNVADILYGYPCDATQFNDEQQGTPLIRIRDVLLGKTNTYTREILSKEYIIQKGDLLVGMDGNFHTGNWKDIDAYLCQRVCKISSKNECVMLNRFLSHYLPPVMKQLELSKPSGTVKHLLAKDINSIVIPVPPIEVQSEIVRILDNFTELTAELTARKKQYEYYRDSLLTFGDDVPMVKLGSFASIIRGGNFQKKDFVEDGKPCIHYGQMYTHFGVYAHKTLKFVNADVFDKSKKAAPNDIVMAVTSENVEDVCSCTAWLGKEPIAVSGHTAIIRHNQNPKYLSYYFRTAHFFSQKRKLAHGTKVIEVTPDKLNDILIPLPSMEEQNRIVSILDRFDTLCNDLSAGLPAEIAARQKQYEYYRDKLLTFQAA